MNSGRAVISKDWILIEQPPRFDGDEEPCILHAMPDQDFEEHELHWNCFCQPFIEVHDSSTGEQIIRHKFCIYRPN